MLVPLVYGPPCRAMGLAIDSVLRPARVRVARRATVNMMKY